MESSISGSVIVGRNLIQNNGPELIVRNVNYSSRISSFESMYVNEGALYNRESIFQVPTASIVGDRAVTPNRVNTSFHSNGHLHSNTGIKTIMKPHIENSAQRNSGKEKLLRKSPAIDKDKVATKPNPTQPKISNEINNMTSRPIITDDAIISARVKSAAAIFKAEKEKVICFNENITIII